MRKVRLLHAVRSIPLLVCLVFCGQPHSQASPWQDWNSLEKEIRDGSIGKEEARARIVELDRQLRQALQGKTVSASRHFPVKGYDPGCIGGLNGSGYQPAGYDFYDGNRHGGHPAHDLFTRDADYDDLDDSTGKAVEVVAFTAGMVIATNPAWEYPSEIRGGIYIWIYSPDTGTYCYYAHLAAAQVQPGDWVPAGRTIGLLGRTGKNAWPKRSPTHLHFMCLSFDRGRMIPHNTYGELLEAVTH